MSIKVGTKVKVIGDPEYNGRTGVVIGEVEDDACSCCPGKVNMLEKVLLDDGCGYELFAASWLEVIGGSNE